MLITTGNEVAGHDIVHYLGVVRGIVVRSTGFARGLVGGLRSVGGGNIPEYVAVCEEAREQAYELMVQHATECGADAIVAMRYDATEFIQGSTEVFSLRDSGADSEALAPFQHVISSSYSAARR